eukprot:14200686-Alexandrium_andersonii.AAC.1
MTVPRYFAEVSLGTRSPSRKRILVGELIASSTVLDVFSCSPHLEASVWTACSKHCVLSAVLQTKAVPSANSMSMKLNTGVR